MKNRKKRESIMDGYIVVNGQVMKDTPENRVVARDIIKSGV